VSQAPQSPPHAFALHTHWLFVHVSFASQAPHVPPHAFAAHVTQTLLPLHVWPVGQSPHVPPHAFAAHATHTPFVQVVSASHAPHAPPQPFALQVHAAVAEEPLPVVTHIELLPHVPQLPPQPLSPHDLPVQFGTH
jgi:hypothetical protein